MISGKIREFVERGHKLKYSTSLNEEGEQLSLRDQDGTFSGCSAVIAINLKGIYSKSGV